MQKAGNGYRHNQNFNCMSKGTIKPAEFNQDDRKYPAYMNAGQWQFVISILEKELKYQKHLVQKTRDFPSDTIRSGVTREIKESIIFDIEQAISCMIAEAF